MNEIFKEEEEEKEAKNGAFSLLDPRSFGMKSVVLVWVWNPRSGEHGKETRRTHTV